MKPVGLAEAAGRLTDGWHVFTGRKDAIQHFGDSRDDVLKSFWVVMWLCPTAIAVTLLHSELVDVSGPFLWVSAQFVYFAIALVYWPLAMAYISIVLKKPERWAHYVVASNWTMTIPFAMQIALIASAEVIGYELSTILLYGVRLWSIFVSVRILREIFETSIPATIALVLADYAISKALGWVTQSIIILGTYS